MAISMFENIEFIKLLHYNVPREISVTICQKWPKVNTDLFQCLCNHTGLQQVKTYFFHQLAQNISFCNGP